MRTKPKEANEKSTSRHLRIFDSSWCGISGLPSLLIHLLALLDIAARLGLPGLYGLEHDVFVFSGYSPIERNSSSMSSVIKISP